MAILVGTETVLLVLLALLVLGLLRSHAEILRRLNGGAQPSPLPAPGTRATGKRAVDVAGRTPSGDARVVAAVGADTLLAFLDSGCSSCAALLDELERRGAPAGLPRLVVVAKDADEERPRRFAAAARDTLVVMSSQAWRDYAVPGSPYFVYVDGARGLVVGEGSAPRWDRVAELVTEMRDDAPLTASGIAPGDSSLYPSRSWPSS